MYRIDKYPIGEDAWNRSKESRQHPELFSSGHGTVDLPWSTEEQPSDKKSTKKENQSNTDTKEHNLGGHTVRHGYPTRSVKRDLNNI